jgi:UDP-N-acetylmuramoylalanine--D-glutamate ligase
MMPMRFDVAGRRVVVVGAGRSGRAAIDLLRSRGAMVSLVDSGAAIEGADDLRASGVAVFAGSHPDDILGTADLIVLSPGVPRDERSVSVARAHGVPVIGEVELAYRWLQGRVIAITGTKGKSTTTTLTARMLTEGGFQATAGGNLGVALSSLVEQSRPESIHVVEVSSFQLETIDTFHPWISVFVNLSPDHLDRHGSFDEYRSAKAGVFRNQTSDDWAVINADDPAVLELARAARARRFDFALDASIAQGVTVDDGFVVERRDGNSRRVMPVDAVQVPGRHLLADVLAAAAASLLAGVDPAAVERAVRAFSGLEHALERVASVGGVAFVNDSKATNVVSARRAIESFEHGVVPILGGRYKGGDFNDLREVVAARTTGLVVIGEAADRIEQALGDLVPTVRAASMTDAVTRGYAMATAGGVVLLAPACSSFDMFTDYAARGRAFRSAVAALAAGEETASEA